MGNILKSFRKSQDVANTQVAEIHVLYAPNIVGKYPNKSIPLEPATGGGYSININSLKSADIIVSTTNSWKSNIIKKATSSNVSHAMLYIGSGLIVESIPNGGVIERRIEEALSDAVLAVAYRDQTLIFEQQSKITDFALSQRGNKYDKLYAVFGDIKGIDDDKMFCSELIIRAYQYAGSTMIIETPQSGSPQTIVEANISGQLKYIGHLKTE